LDKARRETDQQESEYLLLKGKSGVERIPLDGLEYLEVMNKTVFFRMTDGSTREISGPLSEFEDELLSRPEFFKVHRSYLLNLRCVQSLSVKGAATKAGRTVPVSKLVYPQAKDAYMHLLFGGEQTEPAPADPVPPPTGEGRRVLLVEDESDQREYWSGILRSAGYETSCADGVESAIHAAAEGRYDCVVLDVMLPGGSGFDLCRRLREMTGAPVIFLSSLTDADSQLRGFQSGGIDYITKDTPPHLFRAKVETRIKLSRIGRTQLRFGPLLLDLSIRRVFLEDTELSLTPTEIDLLWKLAEHPEQVMTPEELYRAVWGSRQWDEGQTVQVHMSRLRRKLEKAYSRHYFIETVWGQGYRFIPPA
ncbi:MAG: response regulator, partial [Clostridia bacterium]|nr:response regulator [Clostridia bacterium]